MAKKDFVARGSAWIPRAPEDGTSVTILYTKVLYQVSASPTDIPTSWVEDIKNAIQTDSKPYLWSKTIVAYSDNNKTATFSVSYKGKDGTNGTSFTPKGTATGFFYNMSSVPSCEDGMDSDVYIVNVDDRSNPTSELPPYVCHFEYENFIIEHAEFGDGYNVKGHLYVANSNEWVDFGEIQGAKGEKGDDGMDAINIVFSPAELVFDADENGNLKQAEKSAEVKVFRGNKQLTYLTDWDFPNVGGKQPGDNCKASFMVEGNNSLLKPIVKIYEISSTDIVGTNPQAKVPASSGGINVPIKVGDITYNAYLSFAVNVNTFAHTLIQDNKKYISKYTEISNKYDAVSSELKNKADLKTVESTIEQTAENIKLEVLSKTSGRRNMLVNSAFRNQDSVFIHSLARIEKNTGVDGVNCIHSSDMYSGTGDGNYIGAFWDSTQKNGVVTNIPISKGKKYVISCWIKSDNLDLSFNIECLYMKSINQQSRDGVDSAISVAFKVHEKNKWEKISCVLDTNNADATEYLAVNFWSNNKNVPNVTDVNGKAVYPTCHAYICKPMMEEGDTYGGWTLSEDDYDYVGGNILDNTRSLEKSGNLETEDSEIINEGYEYAYAVAHSNNTTSTYIDMLQWNMVGRINDGQDYMFSFLAKGTGVVSTYLWKDGTPSFFVESSNNKHDAVSTDGNVDFELTNEWKRYWVHYHLNTSSGHPLPEKLLIRCNSGNDIYVCQPKLEIGATMTEFTERKTDLVDKASLKKAGIEITTDKVKLYGDKVEVVTTTKNEDGTSTDTQTAMFSNGKLNANLIDAETINVNHVYARSSEGANIIGHFGNFDKDDAVVGSDKCPLWLGAALAKDAPFRVTSLGDLYSNSGKIGPFWISPPAFRDCLVSGTFTNAPDVTKYTSYIKLSKDLIDVVGKDDSTSGDIAGSTSMRRVRIGIETKIDDYINPLYVKAWIEGHSSIGSTATAGIIVDSQGSLEVGRAFWARFGSYAGFRRAIYEASEGFNAAYVCCEGYGLVVMNNTQQVTITCPADYDGLEEGSELVIIRNNGNLYFSGQVIQTGNGHVNITATAKYEIIHLYYLGSKGWYLNFESNY
nr:MAG TPA: hypothetical protein [Bacteriophage sp.]